ncbi:isochorismatase family protein [Candidatus Woesearchaeota archaeon]|nr:isochorismatase family protein [Candidatus Woesearchaeota archaeon]
MSNPVFPGSLKKVLDNCLEKGERPAALLIDMQEGPFGKRHREGAYPLLNHKIFRQREMLRQVLKRNIPLYLVESSRKENGPTLSYLRQSIKYAGGKVTTITKQSYSACKDTSLESMLDKKGITTLLLMGWHANVCVLETARSVYKKYKIITAPSVVIGDAWNQSEEIPREKSTELFDKFYFNHCQVYDDLWRLEEGINAHFSQGQKPAVLLIDMQNGLKKRRGPFGLHYGGTSQTLFERFTKQINRQKEILQYAKAVDLSIAVVEFFPRYDGKTISDLREIVENYSKTKFFSKEHKNAFKYTTGLEDFFSPQQPLVVMGFSSVDCVLETVVDALERKHPILTSPTVVCPTEMNAEKQIIPTVFEPSYFSYYDRCLVYSF